MNSRSLKQTKAHCTTKLKVTDIRAGMIQGSFDLV